MKNFFILFGLSLILAVSSTQVNAQCKKMATNEALPKLEGFTPTGRLYATYVTPGSTSQLKVILTAGYTYRIVNVVSKRLKSSTFQLLNPNNEVMFDSADHGNVEYWDFRIAATSEYTIKTLVGGKGGGQECSVVLMGFQLSE